MKERENEWELYGLEKDGNRPHVPYGQGTDEYGF